ncbi:TetR/AcrR family transcriptional regulator [Variovorax ginsengisoli]|uniref:AcrR family transcriptional regulator n=1 Tax=Variovorax ginsengisoli TaxID=363844 RepID=A0ABT9S521_9BURK|nr:TetR/AcrR family transcriptional regulator [Variovorax ginsengisoli]MDP9898462.1 AcrR family transcriptional regulator [Variovorax ginsengisoli]
MQPAAPPDLPLPSPRRARGRPNAEQAAELREALLSAALQSFLERGYAATSIEAVARDAGVAKITIYRQYENKEALFHEVVHRAVQNARATMQATLVRDNADVRSALLDLVERMYLSATEPATLALLRLVIAEAVRFPELAKSLYAENHYVLAPVVAYLAEAHRSGRLHVPSPELAAVQLSTLAFGGVRFFISKPLAGGAERRAWAEDIVDLMLRGWAPLANGTAFDRPGVGTGAQSV